MFERQVRESLKAMQLMLVDEDDLIQRRGEDTQGVFMLISCRHVEGRVCLTLPCVASPRGNGL